jgi:hypothetical protein
MISSSPALLKYSGTQIMQGGEVEDVDTRPEDLQITTAAERAAKQAAIDESPKPQNHW